MNKAAEIITTAEEIIVRIPRRIIEKRAIGHIDIRPLRGLMKRSRYAKQDSVTAQHAAWQTNSATS